MIRYVGQVIRNNMGDKREEYYDKAGVGSCYLFRLDEDCIVDATRRGHIGRFINHCCSPNAYAKTVEIGPHTRKIVIIALKDIKAGDTAIKYGEDIGKFIADIEKGAHVHTHNCKTKRW